MGNIEVTDLAPVRDDERRELNLSRKVNYKQYCKHVRAEYAQSCLTEIPWSIRDSISLYERMDLSFNRISELPMELPLRLPHLHTLNMSHNQLASLPEGFSLLFHLKDLKLNHNKLVTLPESFSYLVKLEKLDLSYNLLRHLPNDMGTMEALHKLNLHHNRLKTLPASFGKSETLKVLVATHNKLTFPPLHIANEGSDAILKFMRRNVCNGHATPVVDGNVFARTRQNQAASSVGNPDSAQAEYIQQQTHTTNTAIRMKTPLLPPHGSSKLDALDVRDRILGIVFGAAIGDALGVATQFMTVDECQFHYDSSQTLTYTDIIRDAHRTRWRQGDWTANFDHFCLVLDSIIRWAGVVDELDFAKRLQAWRSHGFPELGDTEGYTFCKTILAVLEKDSYVLDPHHIAQLLIERQQTTEFHHGDADDEETENESEDHTEKLLSHAKSVESVAETSFSELTETNADRYADNGALARSLVLGIPFFHNEEEVSNNTTRICRATHADRRCLAVASTLTTMLALILQGAHDLNDPNDVTKLIEKCSEFGKRHLNDPSHESDYERACRTADLESVDANEPGQVVYVMKTLSVACAALRSHKDFREVIYDVIMMGGDSCTNASVGGALVGAKYGYSRLPSEWLSGLRRRQRDWLTIKVNLLLDMMGLP